MADCADRENIEFLFTEDDVDDESLLTSVSMIESQNSDELEDVESELDSVWNDVSFCIYLCHIDLPSERIQGRLQSLLLRNCHRL